MQSWILIMSAKEVINYRDDSENMHICLFLVCCPFFNCTPTVSFNHFSFIRGLLIGLCDPLILPRFFLWPCAAVETLCEIVCMATANEEIQFCSMATTVWPWWFLGAVKWIELEIKCKLKELKAPHIFTYLTAREEAMFVQPILCRKSHAWENGSVTLPKNIICDTDQSELWLLGHKTLSFHFNNPNNVHILEWAHPESHFCKAECNLFLLKHHLSSEIWLSRLCSYFPMLDWQS